MPKSINFGKMKLPAFRLSGIRLREPRMAMRFVLWTLVTLNVAAAIVAFKPFGGGTADDLRREQAELRTRLAELQKGIQTGTRLGNTVDAARRDGDQFFERYVTDSRVFASTVNDEMNRAVKDAGIRPLPSSSQEELIEGSDTLYMVTITGGYEGTYASLKKFVELLDKSPRFFIIESMTVASPQTQSASQIIAVSLKLDTFKRVEPGDKL